MHLTTGSWSSLRLCGRVWYFGRRPLDPLQFPDDELKYQAKLCSILPSGAHTRHWAKFTSGCRRLLRPGACADFQMFTSDAYDRKTLPTRSWLYSGKHQTNLYTEGGYSGDPNLRWSHVFGLEEAGVSWGIWNRKKEKFIVLPDMRKEWPKVFVD
jgi:hypothetical protein